MSDRTCSIEGCAKAVESRGWCTAHYTRWLRHGDPTAGRRPQSPSGALLAFARLAAQHEGDACLLWPYGKGQHGYGILKVGGKYHHAHRLVLQLATGRDGHGLVAAHAPGVCHNRLCVNPGHLRWATSAENTADMVPDATAPKGERHGMAKLTEAQVLAIRADRRPHAATAADFGISAAHVKSIRLRRAWRSI